MELPLQHSAQRAVDETIQSVEFDADLIRKLDRTGPRYTSYPTADRFTEAFKTREYTAWAGKRNVGGIKHLLSLYFHIPFCASLCFYCACNKVVTKNRGKAAQYLDYLFREIDMQSRLFKPDNRVEQLHWGGGTPTFLSPQQMCDLMRVTRENFTLVDDTRGEYSIEVDPRTADEETVGLLRDLGFNRVSLGVQDFDPAVQKAVHRIQSEEETLRVINAARHTGFKSVSVDLIYGLPLQTVMSFNRTLDRIIAMDPDRLSLYNYAHLPELFKPQRRINAADLPSPEVKLDILRLSIQKLTRAGYLYIGMDHFAKPDNELAIAQRQGRLHRNFQGYSTHADCDLVAMGVSAISKMGPTYSQNYRSLEDYYDRLDMNVLPVMRGLELSPDDLLRRAIINALMCHFVVSIEAMETAYLIDFKKYFAEELEEIKELEDLGLLTVDDAWITITLKGRLLVRNVCMVFDKYLRAGRRSQYSRVI